MHVSQERVRQVSAQMADGGEAEARSAEVAQCLLSRRPNTAEEIGPRIGLAAPRGGQRDENDWVGRLAVRNFFSSRRVRCPKKPSREGARHPTTTTNSLVAPKWSSNLDRWVNLRRDRKHT